MKNKIKLIFDEIEEAISETEQMFPVPIKESKFIEKLKKIKEKYLK